MRVAQSAALAVNITRWTVFLSCGAAMRVAQSAALAVNITRWTVFLSCGAAKYFRYLFAALSVREVCFYKNHTKDYALG